MNDLQVLDIMNRRKLSREHVVSNLGMVQIATKHFAEQKPGKTSLLTILLNQNSQVHLFYHLEVNPSRPPNRHLSKEQVKPDLAILVRVPPDQLEGLVEAAVTKHGNLYRGELAKLIGASKESLEGRTSFYLISLMKLCGLAEANLEQVLKKSKIVSQRGALTREIAGDDELKDVIDDALEGFQALISQSFRESERENFLDKVIAKKKASG